MDESDHLRLALVNAGDEKVVSQEEGEGWGAPQREEEEGVVALKRSTLAPISLLTHTPLRGTPGRYGSPCWPLC